MRDTCISNYFFLEFFNEMSLENNRIKDKTCLEDIMNSDIDFFYIIA